MNNIILARLRTKTFQYVSELFKDTVDKGGHPYMNHILAVEHGVDTVEEKIVALLHDVLEDTDKIGDDLMRDLGIPLDLIKSVEWLTKPNDYTYNEYIDRLIMTEDIVALKVKKSDLENNMDISRIPNPTQKDYDRVKKKYKPTYKKVCNRLNQLNL